MATQSKNDFLDLPSDEESGNDDAGYDSEAADLKPALRPRKRRRLSQDDADASESASDEKQKVDPSESEDKHPSRTTQKKPRLHPHLDDDDEEDEDEEEETSHTTPRAPKQIPPKRNLPTKKKSASKPGVIYLSRIPPFMKPSVLRTYLAPYAPKHGLHRLFLTPEAPATHAARVRAGGNKKRMYSDGWVEFVSKREAKGAVAALNARIVGGKKGGWYHDDVWNMRYLRGFRWDDLMGQMRAENAERDGRMRAELAQSARENARFLAGVEQAKALSGMAEKRRAKREREGDEGGLEETAGRPRATFSQNAVKDKRAGVSAAAKAPDLDMSPAKVRSDVQQVLGNIF